MQGITFTEYCHLSHAQLFPQLLAGTAPHFQHAQVFWLLFSGSGIIIFSTFLLLRSLKGIVKEKIS